MRAAAHCRPVFPEARPMAIADRELLFGMIALQNGLIDQAQLVAAFQAWTEDRSRPFSQVLLDRGALNESDRTRLDGLARSHLQEQSEDTPRSLTDAPTAVRQAIRQLGDPDLDATLDRLEVTADGAPGS